MLCIVVVSRVVSSYFYPGQLGPTFAIVPGIVRLWGLASDLIKRRGTTSVTSIYILLLLLQCFNWKTSSGFWLSLLVGTLHRGEPMVVILSATVSRALHFLLPIFLWITIYDISCQHFLWPMHINFSAMYSQLQMHYPIHLSFFLEQNISEAWDSSVCSIKQSLVARESDMRTAELAAERF